MAVSGGGEVASDWSIRKGGFGKCNSAFESIGRSEWKLQRNQKLSVVHRMVGHFAAARYFHCGSFSLRLNLNIVFASPASSTVTWMVGNLLSHLSTWMRRMFFSGHG